MISSILQRFKLFVYSFFEYSFDSTLLELTSTPLTIPEVERLMKKLQDLHRNDEELSSGFERLREGCHYLNKVALKHDYNENIPANGYHSYCDLILIMSQAVLLMHENNTFDREHCQSILKLLLAGLEICKELDNDCGLFTEKVTFLELLNLAERLRDELCCVYTHYNSCWLYPCVAKVIQLFGLYMGVFFENWQSLSLNNWFLTRARRGRMFTSFSLDSNIDCLKSMWCVTEYRLMKMCLTRSIGLANDIHSRVIFSSRQNRWKVSKFEYETVYDLFNDTNVGSTANCSKKTVRSLYLRSSKARMKDRNVLIHVHGGGFISQSPETHSYYLADWIENLKNITVLSVDYTLSPEGPFPEALQEVLDLYLWLISDDAEVKRLLGFKPKKIAICGDSAGGNIAAALVLVLSKIREKQSSKEVFPYPCSLLLFYSPLVLTTSLISPSRLLTSVDCLIPLAPLLNCMRSYVPDEVFPLDDQIVQTDESSLTKFRNWLFPNCRCQPWFKQKERLDENMLLMNRFLSNPFASPLLTRKFEYSKDIRLYCFGTSYDPFLDDTVQLCKHWLGPKQLFIMPRLPHGFLNLVKISEKSASTLTKVLEFIVDAFDSSCD